MEESPSKHSLYRELYREEVRVRGGEPWQAQSQQVPASDPALNRLSLTIVGCGPVQSPCYYPYVAKLRYTTL